MATLLLAILGLLSHNPFFIKRLVLFDSMGTKEAGRPSLFTEEETTCVCYRVCLFGGSPLKGGNLTEGVVFCHGRVGAPFVFCWARLVARKRHVI